jgi:predicted ATPase
VRASAGDEALFATCLRSIAASRALGHERGVPAWFMLLAEGRRAAGRAEEGLDLLEEVLGRVERTREGWIKAELHRLKGDLLLWLSEPDDIAAEARFRRAIAIARAQDARLWELRASMSLVRLWMGQGRGREARDLLAPVYGWFTEGFDTPDLTEAKALLAALSSTPVGSRAGPQHQPNTPMNYPG